MIIYHLIRKNGVGLAMILLIGCAVAGMKSGVKGTGTEAGTESNRVDAPAYRQVFFHGFSESASSPRQPRKLLPQEVALSETDLP